MLIAVIKRSGASGRNEQSSFLPVKMAEEELWCDMVNQYSTGESDVLCI